MNKFEKELLGCCREYRVITTEKNHLEADGTFSFPPSFSGFQGHFPSQPVLPAVIQLAMIRLLAEQILTQRLIPLQYGKTKFRQIIQPEQDVIAQIRFAFEKQRVRCRYQLKQIDGQVISEGRCLFEYI